MVATIEVSGFDNGGRPAAGRPRMYRRPDGRRLRLTPAGVLARTLNGASRWETLALAATPAVADRYAGEHGYALCVRRKPLRDAIRIGPHTLPDGVPPGGLPVLTSVPVSGPACRLLPPDELEERLRRYEDRAGRKVGLFDERPCREPDGPAAPKPVVACRGCGVEGSRPLSRAGRPNPNAMPPGWASVRKWGGGARETGGRAEYVHTCPACQGQAVPA